ncbi:hypothetical protein GX48_06278 [Paracoccidioides brasiliensis]|nr:hypothetical protein GX48_06278 [Paracoccidioides brasiliensis]
MPVKVITLAGAPRPSTLRWDESELLNECWFCRTSADGRDNPTAATASSVRWRAITQHEDRYGFPASEGDEGDKIGDGGEYLQDGDMEFLAPGAIERHTGLQLTMDSEVEPRSEFYDHSFAVHEVVDSTMLSEMESFHADSNFETTLEEKSIVSAAPPSTQGSSMHHPLPPPLTGPLSEIKDIPNAAHIRSVSPRVIPVNLIGAVITIHPRKRVRTRWGYETDVVELVVGDETKSGFRITCWLPLKEKSCDGAKQDLDKSISGLRPRDIVLFRSVALNSFRGKVYGQSLKGNMTKIDLLHRMPVDSSDMEGLFTCRILGDRRGDSHPQLTKVRRVREWILDFISPHIYGMAGQQSINSSSGGLPGEPYLPPDTQQQQLRHFHCFQQATMGFRDPFTAVLSSDNGQSSREDVFTEEPKDIFRYSGTSKVMRLRKRN